MTKRTLLAEFSRHGGRLDVARQHFPTAPRPWIDLSTGVNPHAWNDTSLAIEDLQRLPLPSDIDALEEAAAHVFGCDPSHVAAVPGVDMGLRLLPFLRRSSRVAIVTPTYSGHCEAWRMHADVREVSMQEMADVEADVCVVVNPNNPDGSCLTPEALLAFARQQAASGGCLVVDESFADATPEISIVPQQPDNVIVLRSFGKFYGLPGLRLGFVIAPPAVIAALRVMTGDWPVSTTAAQIGTAAYGDVAWQTTMRQRLTSDVARLDGVLTAAGLDVMGGTSLFRLVSSQAAELLFMRLAAAGILVRPFAVQPQWLRLGLPRPSDWPRLEAALKDRA